MTFEPRVLHPERSVRDLLGADIRRHRERMGLSLARLAKILNYSKSQLSRIETAELLPSEDLVPRLDLLFETGDHFQRLYAVARREKFPGKYQRAIELEAAARVIEEYTCQNVPGLLQTREVAQRMLRAGYPHLPPSDIDAMVGVRLERQARLSGDSPPRCSFILDEAVLRRPVGGPATMAAQLGEIIRAAAESSHITVQVLPFSTGEHPEMGGSLSLYTLPDRLTIGWSEGSQDGTMVDDPDAVAARRESYDLLRAQALSPQDSEAVIRAVMKEYEHHAAHLRRPPVA
ncbi:helix-turn-helix domain-containing protein [Actinacidiphila epipremni]|uniref:Helix-turn-helix domain-containing protein n=1 Tax=Actinacidiphila epipremni TaxID=2053013 RepID=A0ABX0ZIK4_9ACTN|nr:helix-turn-helix transcriptional regulator [Actinacidiphila epipremni]NJP42637.1 helix-turn-helix domain-containing protein [Actinacidiphila epipremni]